MSRGEQERPNEHAHDSYRGGLNLPHKLQMLPDDAVVQWGWVRRKLLAVENDPLEATFRYWGWMCTRNLSFDSDGKRRTKQLRQATEAEG